MFTTNVRGGKVLAAEQKIRELKKRLSKEKTISDQNKAKISPATIINCSAENMNNVKSKKYRLTLNEIEKKSLENRQFRTEFNFERINISKTKTSDKLDRYDRTLYSRKNKKLRKELNVGEKVLILAERLKKKSAPTSFINNLFKISLLLTKKMFLLQETKKKLKIKHFIG